MRISDLTVTMSKYSQRFLRQQMIPSVYRHIIIDIIQLYTNLKINAKTGGFIFTNMQNIGTLLDEVQAHHSQ